MTTQGIKNETLLVYLLAASEFCHVLDFVIMMPLAPTFMREFSISAQQFALLVSSYSLSAALFAILVGLIADFFERKKFLLIMFTGFIAGTVFCAMAQSYPQLMTARVITGAFGGVINVAIFSILAEIVPYARRGRATGVVMSAFSMASVLGVPLGLTLALAQGSSRAPFWAIALFASAIYLLILLIFPKLKEHLKENQSFQITHTLRRYLMVFTHPTHLQSFFIVGILTFSTFSLIPFISPFAVNNLGILEEDLRLIYLVGGFFTVLSSRLIGIACDHFGVLKVFLTVGLASTLPMIGYTHLWPMPLYLILTMTTLFMMLASGRFVPTMTLVTQIPPMDQRATFMSILSSSRSFCMSCAAFLAGLFITTQPDGSLQGYPQVSYLSVSLTLLALFLFARLYQKVR